MDTHTHVWWCLFPCLRGFGGEVWQVVPCLHFKKQFCVCVSICSTTCKQQQEAAFCSIICMLSTLTLHCFFEESSQSCSELVNNFKMRQFLSVLFPLDPSRSVYLFLLVPLPELTLLCQGLENCQVNVWCEYQQERERRNSLIAQMLIIKIRRLLSCVCHGTCQKRSVFVVMYMCKAVIALVWVPRWVPAFCYGVHWQKNQDRISHCVAACSG